MDSELENLSSEREEWENLSSEQSVRKFIEFIEDFGRAALSYKKLTEKDKKDIEKGLSNLRPAFAELCKVFIDPLRETNPSLADHGYDKLGRILSWAWTLGSQADVPESSNPYWQSLRAMSPRHDPIEEKILAETSRGASRHIIAKRLGLEDNAAFKQKVYRAKKSDQRFRNKSRFRHANSAPTYLNSKGYRSYSDHVHWEHIRANYGFISRPPEF